MSMEYSGEKRYQYRGGRKGFDKNGGVLCKGCFEKDLQLQELKEELKRVKDKLRRSGKEATWNDVENEPHMPSSRRLYKKKATEENRKKKGGAQLGHKGHGRKKGSIEDERKAEEMNHCQTCPDCNVALSTKDTKTRTVVEVTEIKAKRRVWALKRGQCPRCRKVYQPTLEVLPKALYGNRLLSQAAVMHYVHGVTIGRLLEIFGSEVTEGGIMDAFHRLGAICQSARIHLMQLYRGSYTKHADETGWRTDGCSGYAWIFTSEIVTLFDFRETRSSRVAQEIFGHHKLPGVLVVDRYGGYNRVPIKIQYCYAHLLREVEKLKKEFPDNNEVDQFSDRMAIYLTQAMKLRSLGLNKQQYLNQAQIIKSNIQSEVKNTYKHLGIKHIQQIFQEKSHRLYHWADDARVPADNNRAERELRPTVVCRKTSFGSQSEKGAKTRSHVMSVLWTAKKRLKNQHIEDWLFSSLNKIAVHPNLNIYDLLPIPP